MSPGKWRSTIIFLIIFLFSNVSGAFVGVNIGTDMSNLPPATAVVEILKKQKITHARLFDADHHMLNALANTGIEVIVGIPNDELLGIGQLQSKAAEWVNQNVATFLPATNITAIAVGSEVLTSIPNAALLLVPAIKNLQSALVASNINYQVKISTPLAMDLIPKPFPPSTAAFNSTWNDIMKQLLQFLKNTDSYLMLNVHPYYGYVQANGIFPIEYALFRPLPSTKQIVDANTLFHYDSMFDAMVDAAYYSMQALNFSGVPVLVTESGWPWSGGANEPEANEDNAQEYNNNLIQRVLNGSGTPSQPDIPVSAYLYELFNEDLRPGLISEKNWGFFFTNGSAVYPLSLSSRVSQIGGNSSTGIGVFCVSNGNATSGALLEGLNWACGLGNANCSAIQEGHPCYDPNNLDNHASYAYNDYYHRTVATGRTCDFGGTAMITSNDPSYGFCIFAGSLKSNTSSSGSTNSLGPSDSFPNGAPATKLCKFLIVVPPIILSFVVGRADTILH
ncbi:glucan endo-1,3-beta-glucosidase 4-like [Aristolochia californica]|uniref:glucan endo-1,3-beta-glucosidase 4-like n=1 Tax=Aristolochia californica TaxID=171875 RepID=UPI0035D9F17D